MSEPRLPLPAVRVATEPMSDEAARLAVGIDPALLDVVRVATAPGSWERVRAPARPAGAARAVRLAPVALAALVVIALLPRGPERLDLQGGASLGPSITLSGEGSATAAATDDGFAVDLHRGRIDAAVDPHGARRALKIRAGDATVYVVGTVFSVDWDGKRGAVSVERGVVRVERPGGELLLRAGQRVAWPDGFGIARGEGSETPSRPALSPVPTSSRDVAIDPDPVEPPDSSAVAAPRDPRDEASPRSRGREVVAALPSVRESQSPARPDDGPAEKLAAANPSASDPAAPRHFARLLEALPSASPADAVALTEAFLLKHPGGPLAEEAAILRLRALGDGDDRARALAEIEAFLDAGRGGDARGDLHGLAGLIAMGPLRDCARALPHLRLADALPEYRMPLGHCAEALGLLDEARAAYVSVRDDRLASPVERGLGRIALEALSPLLKEPR